MTVPELFGHLLAAGVWPALPLTGYWAFRASASPDAGAPLITRLSLRTCAGLVIWSVPLLGSAALGLYRPEILGAAGWVVCGMALPRLFQHIALVPPRLRDGEVLSGAVVLAGLGLAAALYFAFPGQNLAVRDEAVYANHGVYIAREGRLDVRYPWPTDAATIFEGAYQLPGGLELTTPTMGAQFAHLFPAWLAQAFATLDERTMFRLNAALATLALAVFYGLVRLLIAQPLPVLATLFLAFNVSQIWVARLTLSEIMAQWFILSGLLLLVVALRERRLGAARWSGIFFGAAAIARVDGFLLVPLLLLAHLALRILRDDADSDRVWRALYETALPTFALALLAYLTLSGPYFSRLGSQVSLIGVLALAALVAHLIVRRGVLARIRPLATNRVAVAGAALLLVALAAWAYWIRPISPPFDYFTGPTSPRLGTRTYAENSLLTLALYLSPGVVWAAVAGAAIAIWRWVKQMPSPAEVALLVIASGFAAVYLWQPSVSPSQFWGIRRFVPIIIPAFVLFATLALGWALARFAGAIRMAVIGVVAMALALFTLSNGGFVFKLTEFRGYYSTLRLLAAQLPANEPILYRGVNSIGLPLFLSFDRKLISLDLQEQAGRDAFLTWVDRQTAAGKPTLLLYENVPPLVGFDYSRRFEMIVSRTNSDDEIGSLPRRTAVDRRRLGLYEIRGPRRSALKGVNLVTAIVWGVHERGVLAARAALGAGRWTTGDAQYDVANDVGTAPSAVAIGLGSTGPNGTRLRVFVNGTQVLDRQVGVGGWSGTVPVPGDSAATSTSIRIVSDTFASPRTPNDVLGVRLTRVELIARTAAKLAITPSAARRT